MKRLLFLILLIFITSNIIADEFEVKSFEKDESDLAARKYERKDINDEPCALIKIRTDLSGLNFNSSLGIVGDVEYKNAEYWIYISPKERRFEIFKTGFIKLDYDIPYPVASYDVFHMVLAAKETGGGKLPVTFIVIPADAGLTVDGKEIDNEVPVELEIGEHSFTAKRENYQTLNKTIRVDKQHVLFRFEMEEVQDIIVRITSRPSEATVFLDGVKIGQTPLAAFYPAGNYPVKITKPGYVAIEDQYLQVKSPLVEKHFVLEEDVGYLTIKTRPEARVYFNGNEVEANKKIKLTPQLVKVKVEMAKAATIEENVVIKRNDDKTLELFPEIQTGTIQIAVTPFDANIELKGDGGEYYTASGSYVFSDIPVGTYQLQISKDGFKTHKSTLSLTANEKMTKSIKLAEGTDISSDMVFVKGGCFDMGCTSEQSNCFDDEKPTHRVCVDDFYIGKYEVTNANYIEFLNDAGVNSNGSKNGTEYIEYIDMYDDDCAIGYRNGSFYFKGSSYADHEDCPVIEVTWYGAEAYCKWSGGRLPTEAEWEYAARGGQESNGYKYSGSNNLDEVGWYWKNSGDDYLSGNWNWDKIKKNNCKTHKVGQKNENELGIYDMSGNVWEWCSDWYGSYYYGSSPDRNPQGPANGSYRVHRGGHWNYGARYCRVADRYRGSPDFSTSYMGFRLARSLSR